MLAGETVCTTLVDIAAARQLTEFVGIDTNYKMNCHTSIVAKGHQVYCIVQYVRPSVRTCICICCSVVHYFKTLVVQKFCWARLKSIFVLLLNCDDDLGESKIICFQLCFDVLHLFKGNLLQKVLLPTTKEVVFCD